MSEINAQNTATETEAKNFYEWLERNKARYDAFMSHVFNDSPFPPAIKDDAALKFKIVNRALESTIYAGHGLMFSAAMLWEMVKPTLTPEQIEQFKQADLETVSGKDIFDKIAAVHGKDEAKRQMESAIDQAEQRKVHFAEEKAKREQCGKVEQDEARDPKDYCV